MTLKGVPFNIIGVPFNNGSQVQLVTFTKALD